MTAWSNELEPYPAQWTRNLIAAGLIVPGIVDERSICDLTPADVAGPGQRHFFCGLSGWGLALRLAGVPDDASIWTGSCPCQPLSVAGLQRGHQDHRHLWPVWYRLVAECRPPVILGEQVGGPVGRAWLTAVRADLEDLGYAVGAADLAAASVGAPHIRQRIFFGAVRGVGLADTDQTGWLVEWRQRLLDRERAALGHDVDGCSEAGGVGLADSQGGGRAQRGVPGDARVQRGPGPTDGSGLGDGEAERRGARRSGGAPRRATVEPAGPGDDGHGLGQPIGDGAGRHPGASVGPQAEGDGAGLDPRRVGDLAGPPGGDGGPWEDAELIACHDPKRGLIYRPTPPASSGIQPVAARLPGDVAQLRASGNAICPQAAAAFVTAFLEAVAEMTL